MMSEQDISTASVGLQELLPKLDVDAVRVASMSDLKGSRLEEMALRLLPEVRSVLVFTMEVFPEILDHSRPNRVTGMASLNDMLDRHADYLGGRLTKAAYDVAKASRSRGLKALPLPAVGCPYDTRFMEAVFSYKHAGQAAGLGYIGRSSLLITPDFGPRVRLACCLTEAQLEPGKTTVTDVCQDCEICIVHCPSQALSLPQTGEPYIINKFACSAFRGAAGGCSECVRLCPAGR